MRRYRIKECGMTSELPRYTVCYATRILDYYV